MKTTNFFLAYSELIAWEHETISLNSQITKERYIYEFHKKYTNILHYCPKFCGCQLPV
jgi:hypothetical protein